MKRKVKSKTISKEKKRKEKKRKEKKRKEGKRKEKKRKEKKRKEKGESETGIGLDKREQFWEEVKYQIVGIFFLLSSSEKPSSRGRLANVC